MNDEPQPRLWLVCFSDSRATWWSPFLATGFRHVSAAAWYEEAQRWVYVDPTRRGLVVEIWTEDEFGRRLGQLMHDSTVILRVPSRRDMQAMPGFTWWCVGSIKALLGIRARALVPRGLYRHLLTIGAETVEYERPNVEAVQDSEAAAGRPGGHALAQSGASASGS